MDLQEQGQLCVAHSFMAGTSVSSQTSNEKEALTSKASSSQRNHPALFVSRYLSQFMVFPSLISFYRAENIY